MKIEITPLDTLFFKDAKAFNMEDETWADSFFPPYPSVLYGALRTVYFANHVDELDKATTKQDPTRNLVIKNISYNINGDIYYPLPKSIVKLKGSKEQFIKLTPKKNKFVSSQLLINSFCRSNLHSENIENGCIMKSSLANFLKCNIKEKDGILKNLTISTFDKYIKIENKIGIAIDKNKNSIKKENLYRINMLRLEDMKINIEFEGIDIPSEGFIKIGGEGKSLYYEEIEETLSCNPNKEETNKVLLYLSTPSIFKNGWLPSWIDKETLKGKYEKDGIKVKLQLITACLGKVQYVGGYDIKNKSPKPMGKAVPAGSVYYFEIEEGSKNDIIQLFHNKSISEENTCKEGFGIVYVGSWEE
ncbi:MULTISPECIES: type III-B CRISPR module-associated protein Cmr3 [unclassified Clostridium]|uniref:type III-B CRISPR module-associated protein Cmr3 n=1 Tax=unclassified Clostridium TaxID=2614128 RepID=UPI002079C9AC|nr:MULTISPECIES: type III-B CRISPR module-associated protein Cmr3 [unclassified Clostridium]